MAIRIKAGAGKKWREMGAQSTERYIEGSKNPKESWSKRTGESEDLWKDGVTKAAQKKKFSKGVAAAGDEKWLKGIVDKGSTRYAQGIELGQSAYEAGIQPYFDTIANLTLPKRFAKGDPRNLERVRIVTQALHKKKESLNS